MATTVVFAPPEGAHNSQQKCFQCDQHYYSVEDQLKRNLKYSNCTTDGVAQLQLRYLVQSTQKDLDHVRTRIRTHGNLIISRWGKMSQHSRAVLLSKSSEQLFGPWPQPEELKVDDIEDTPLKNGSGFSQKMIFEMTPDRIRKTRPMWHTMYWLDINEFAEDRMKLLSLVHTRTEYTPQQWVPFDTIKTHMMFGRAITGISYNPGAVIMHGDEYGQLTEFDAELAHSWTIIGFPRALLTLRLQALIMSMLRAAADYIIAGEEMRPVGDSKWLEMVSRGLRSAHENAMWSSYHHPEFTPPQTFDATVLLGKARNQLNLIMDEVELLQTSPEYMCQLAHDLEESIFIGPKSCGPFPSSQDRVATFIPRSSTAQVVMLTRVVEECEHLQAVLADCRVRIRPGARLPGDVDIATQAFGTTIRRYMLILIERLFGYLCTVSGMKDNTLKVDGWTMSDLLDVSKVQATLDPAQKGDRIFWHALGLWKTIHRLTPYGAEGAIRELNLELADVNCNKIVSFMLSTLAVLDELHITSCWHQLIGFGFNDPRWKSTIVRDMESRDGITNSITSAEAETARSRPTQYTSAYNKYLRVLRNLALPQGRKDAAWLKQMTELRKCLTNFWESGRNDFRIRQNMVTMSDASINAILAHMSFDVSAGYRARLETERQQIEGIDIRDVAKKEQQLLQTDAHFIRQSWDIAGAHGDGSIRRKMTKKTKEARGSSINDVELERLMVSDRVVDNDFNESLPALIPVKQDTLSVVRKTFPCSETRLDKGSVRWTNFVQAMTDCGLTATQGAGSAVIFENQEGRICIHEPHPEPTIDAIQLRGYGQRLAKWFGWTHETFVLREKGDEKKP